MIRMGEIYFDKCSDVYICLILICFYIGLKKINISLILLLLNYMLIYLIFFYLFRGDIICVYFKL